MVFFRFAKFMQNNRVGLFTLFYNKKKPVTPSIKFLQEVLLLLPLLFSVFSNFLLGKMEVLLAKKLDVKVGDLFIV